MGLGPGFGALRQVEAQAPNLFVGKIKAVMQNLVQFGAVVLLAQIADDSVQELLLGFQLLGAVGQRGCVAVELCGVVAVLGWLLTGADTGLRRRGADRVHAGQVIFGHWFPPFTALFLIFVSFSAFHDKSD